MARNPRRTEELLRDMRDYALKAQAFVAEFTKNEFLADERNQFAVFHCIEVIGEAAAKLPHEFQEQHPEVPWASIIGMRNVLIHDYFDIDIEIAWETVQQDLPMLLDMLVKLGVE